MGTSVETILATRDNKSALVQHAKRQDIPFIQSEDGLCSLRIIGSIDTVEFVQWYDFAAEPGGRLESSPHPQGSIENLSVITGELTVEIADESWIAKAGETLRYRADRPHRIINTGPQKAHATMVNILVQT